MHSANAVTTLKVLLHTAKQPEIALHGATFSSVCVVKCYVLGVSKHKASQSHDSILIDIAICLRRKPSGNPPHATDAFCPFAGLDGTLHPSPTVPSLPTEAPSSAAASTTPPLGFGADARRPRSAHGGSDRGEGACRTVIRDVHAPPFVAGRKEET